MNWDGDRLQPQRATTEQARNNSENVDYSFAPFHSRRNGLLHLSHGKIYIRDAKTCQKKQAGSQPSALVTYFSTILHMWIARRPESAHVVIGQRLSQIILIYQPPTALPLIKF